MPGSTAQTNKFHTFYLQQRPDNGFTWADIKVNHPLDYETIKEYNLTIRVEVCLRMKGWARSLGVVSICQCQYSELNVNTMKTNVINKVKYLFSSTIVFFRP